MKQVINNYFAIDPQQQDVVLEAEDKIQVVLSPNHTIYINVNGITICRIGKVPKDFQFEVD